MRRFVPFSFLSCISASVVSPFNAVGLAQLQKIGDKAIIEFVSPTCVHCEHLMPEFEIAAKASATEDWTFGMVDCNANAGLCAEENIFIYPTVKILYANETSIYDGYRRAEAIESFLKCWDLPRVSSLNSADQVKKFISTHSLAVIAHIRADDHDSMRNFTDIAEALRGDFAFAVINKHGSSDITRDIPEVTLHKDFGDDRVRFDGSNMNAEDIVPFLYESSKPLVREAGLNIRMNDPAVRGDGLVAYVFADSKAERRNFADEIALLAEDLTQQLLFVTIDPSQFVEIFKKSGIPPHDLPALAIHHPKREDFFVLPAGASPGLNRVSVERFAHGVLDGSIKPQPKPVPRLERADSPILTVKDESFQSLVIDSDHDILLLYYSPKCKHCEAMSEEYEKLAILLESAGSSVIAAKIDATSNVMASGVQKYPTIELLATPSKSFPIRFEGARIASELWDFIEENASPTTAKIMAAARQGLDAHQEL